jgi:hypothetical protein
LERPAGVRRELKTMVRAQANAPLRTALMAAEIRLAMALLTTSV